MGRIPGGTEVDRCAHICERLFIGRGTVKTHLAHVFAKLGIATLSELAAEATRRAL